MRSCAEAASILVLVTAVLAAGSQVSAQSNADSLFKEAQGRAVALRQEMDTRKAAASPLPLLERARTLVGAFEDMTRLFPRSRFSDDSLFEGASLAADTFWEFGQADDRATALRLFKALTIRYPTSALIKQVATQTDRLSVARPTPDLDAETLPVVPPPPRTVPAPTVTPRAAASTPPPIKASPPVIPSKPPSVMLTAIRREVLPGAVRVTIELEGEASYHDEQVEGAPRIFIDLQNARPSEALRDVAQTFPDEIVRQIRIGRQVGTRTRVALELAVKTPHTTYALYNPYRVVIDFTRDANQASTNARKIDAAKEPAAPAPQVTRTPADGAPAGPRSPAVNERGGFSLSRQLGLGVARVVIDPGHGGHDPGALSNGQSEAEVVLDIALRLEKLLLKQPGVDVVMTRRANVFVPLEERTAIANREGADLFLSIHANASEDDRARGIETYFLNFAPNPAAEAVAARENASSVRTMGQLPDIVKAIALNNKIDESRDFASLVQSSMMDRLKRANKNVKDLGVKQAPFMVLIGATMPSILAEISFLTNRQEATLLRGGTYRQQIADALFNGVMRYQRSLKAAAQIASQ